MMTNFISERVVVEFFGETALQTRPYFRRGERKATGTISIRKRQRS
jgi:hypothetical protein